MAKTKAARRARARRAAEARRVRTQRAATPEPERKEVGREPPDRQLLLKAAAMCFLIAAGMIHAVWMGIHLERWATEGIAFLALAMVQTMLGFALIAFPHQRTYLTAIIVSLGTVVLWAISRTVGLPIGPEAGVREPVGAPDLVASFLELLTAVTLIPVVLDNAAPSPSRRRGRPQGPARMGGLTYILLGALGVYTLVLTAVAVVPAASRHEQDEGGHGAAHGGRRDVAPGSSAYGEHGGSGQDAPARVQLVAAQMSFGTVELDLTASRPVRVDFENADRARHNFAVYPNVKFERPVFKGDIIDGGESATYRFRAPSRGRYFFRCDVHPFMNGVVRFS